MPSLVYIGNEVVKIIFLKLINEFSLYVSLLYIIHRRLNKINCPTTYPFPPWWVKISWFLHSQSKNKLAIAITKILSRNKIHKKKYSNCSLDGVVVLHLNKLQTYQCLLLLFAIIFNYLGTWLFIKTNLNFFQPKMFWLSLTEIGAMVLRIFSKSCQCIFIISQIRKKSSVCGTFHLKNLQFTLPIYPRLVEIGGMVSGWIFFGVFLLFLCNNMALQLK